MNPDLALTPDEVDRFLGTHRTVRLATRNGAGTPHVVPLWFAWVDRTLFVNMTLGNRTVRNAETDARAAATIDDGESYEELRGVVLTGRLEPAADDPRLPDVLETYSRKYYGGNPPGFERWKNRIFFRLVPERVTSWDFRKIPEARARRDAAQRDTEGRQNDDRDPSGRRAHGAVRPRKVTDGGERSVVNE